MNIPLLSIILLGLCLSSGSVSDSSPVLRSETHTALHRLQDVKNVTSRQVAIVLFFDVSRTMCDIMVPFVWDGTRDAHGYVVPSGRRLSQRPSDIFLPIIRNTVVPLLEEGDRVRVGIIARSPILADEFTGDGHTLVSSARKLLDVRPEAQHGPSPLWDAVSLGVDVLRSESARRGIILITDGMASGNRSGLDDVIRLAVDANVSVYPVLEWPTYPGPGGKIVDSSKNPWSFLVAPYGSSPKVTLSRLAERTGGSYELDGTSGRSRLSKELLARVFAHLRHQPSFVRGSRSLTP